jgi:hypothetical protein
VRGSSWGWRERQAHGKVVVCAIGLEEASRPLCARSSCVASRLSSALMALIWCEALMVGLLGATWEALAAIFLARTLSMALMRGGKLANYAP